jgi:hypothetical protein
VYSLPEGDANEQIVELAERLECGLVVIGQLEQSDLAGKQGLDFQRVAKNCQCSVCLVAPPSIPQEVAE